jgi:2-(1,2-epoxy-1,2-dihydrophenyl)acetyl-CoA isomerase
VSQPAYQELIVELHRTVATVTLNNPSRLNALSPVMTTELIDLFERFGKDPGIRAIVLTGTGRGFSAGADLTTLKEPYLRGERPKPSRFLREGYNRLIPLMAEAPKPIVAAVNGVVAGAGISVALACDIRLASAEASFSMAFVRIGLIPDAGSTWLLPRTIGMARALELAMLSEKVDAQRALALGLVNRVVPAELLMDEAHDLARRLADLPTVAIALTKRAMREAAQATLSEALEGEADLQDEAAATDDHLEGVLAFLEKRQATFTGH